MNKLLNGLAVILFLATLSQAYPNDGKETEVKHEAPAVLPVTKEEENPLAVPESPAEIEVRAKKFLLDIERNQSVECNRAVVADWAFAANITDENQNKSVEASLAFAAYKKELWKQVIAFPWKDFKDPDTHRHFKLLSNLGTDALPEDKLETYTKLVKDMESIYSKGKVCDFKDSDKCDLSLEPELSNIFQKSRNYSELEHVWLKWRDVSGLRIRDLYPKYVDLVNEAARMNGFKDGAEMWLAPYESESFRTDVYQLFEQIRPLYEQLHAYVRYRLRKQYGSSRISPQDAIPAHLLGNVWGQNWGHILDFTTPYPDKPSVDVSDAMVKKNITVLDMFKESEKFFTSVNLPKMTDKFWANSILQKPEGREIICHASAWDFCDGEDFRIKQCTQVSQNDLIVVHHEMGHISYFQQYKDQPAAYREGANPGFHEAVGDLLALSVSTPKHLKKLNLLENFEDDLPFNINYLYSQALDKVAFIPFSLALDQFRWDVFSGQVKPAEYNCHWWKLRNNYQGLRPPQTRKSTDFDPGAKYHVPANVPYIRYFVSHILQYQLHRSLCVLAGEYDPKDENKPLHKCDIYGNTVAGDKLGNMLKLGSSKPWPEALEQVTGQKVMDGSALLEYYQPLYKWLQEENKKNGEVAGWKESDEPLCINV